jgi:hypothetical protein
MTVCASDEYRRAASECLYLARTTSDLGTRAALLTMAQRWFDLADGSSRRRSMEAAIEALNETQMTKPFLQQQQVQPKK